MALPRAAWTLSTGLVLGRSHAVLRKNRQDAFATRALPGVAVGVVSDGCGQGRGSELGASISAAVAATALVEGARRGLALDALPSRAVASVVSALGDLAARVADPSFAREHLLATLVGFVARGDELIVFAAGDGLVAIDGALHALDQDDRPSYPAYELAGASTPLWSSRRDGARTVAIATDGFDRDALSAVHALGGRTDLGRHLVRLQQKGAFEDDGAIVIARREASPCT